MILVSGATGSIGGFLVQRLLEAGQSVRALVRDKAKGDALGVDYVVADFADPQSLVPAFEGVGQFFLNGGLIQPDSGEQPMVAQQKSAIDAAVAAGVSHIVKISVWGAHIGGRLSEGAHGAVDAYLAEAPVESTVLQPGAFMQNFITGVSFRDEDGNILGLVSDRAAAYTDCYDIAATAAAVLTGPVGRGQTHVLSGTEVVDNAAIAEKLTKASGRPVKFIGLTPEKARAELTRRGVSQGFAEDIVHLWDTVDYSVPTDAVRELTGVAPRTFDEFLAANRAAFA